MAVEEIKSSLASLDVRLSEVDRMLQEDDGDGKKYPTLTYE